MKSTQVEVHISCVVEETKKDLIPLVINMHDFG